MKKSSKGQARRDASMERRDQDDDDRERSWYEAAGCSEAAIAETMDGA